MKKIIIIVGIVVLLASAVAGFLVGRQDAKKAALPVEANGNSVELTVTVTDTGFEPQEIEVGAGDTVRITFVNDSVVLHNFTLSDFEVATGDVGPGASTVIEFLAALRGDFVYRSTQNESVVGNLKIK